MTRCPGSAQWWIGTAVAAVAVSLLAAAGGWAPIAEVLSFRDEASAREDLTRSARAPYPRSRSIAEVRFRDATIRTEAPGSDNWPITWASNDTLYTSWGDGGGFGGTNREGRVSLGIGRVVGGRDGYRGENIAGGRGARNLAPFAGKSEGILAIGDTLYLWRSGDGSERSAFAFSQLHRSLDRGVTWEFTGVEFSRRGGDFGEGDPGFFSPTFAQYGRGYDGAHGGFVYVYAPEAVDPSHWDIQKPGRIALLRVPLERVTRKSEYETFAGLSRSGEPDWTSDLSARTAVWEDAANGTHRMAVSYNPGLERYLLTTMTVDRNGWFALYDAPEPWGPWTTVRIERDPTRWGGKVVAFNFVNKWLRDDGRDFVLVYTRNDSWATIEGELVPARGPSGSVDGRP